MAFGGATQGPLGSHGVYESAPVWFGFLSFGMDAVGEGQVGAAAALCMATGIEGMDGHSF